MKGYAYVRVSSAHQADEGYSVDHQKNAIKEYCKSKGIRLVKIFVDNGKSGRTINRPEFQELLTEVRKQNIDCVIVYKIDRFARNITDFSSIRKEFIKLNISLLSIMEGDITNGSSLVANMFASVAEWESEVNSQRTKDGMMQKFKDGWQPTPPPSGYMGVGGDGERKVWALDPKTAPIIKKLFQLYSTGQYSVLEMQEWMSDKNLVSKNGTILSNSKIHNILTNPNYYGVIRWNGESKIGKHPPLITKQLFEACQYILAKHRNFLIKRRHHDFLLRSFGYCSCGMRLVGEWHTIRSNKKKIGYYHCQKRYSKDCEEPYVQITDLEEQVEKYIESLSFDKEFVEGIIVRAEKFVNNGKKDNDGMKQALINQRSALEAKRNRLEDLLIDEGISRDVYARKHAQLEEMIDNLNNQVEDTEQEGKLDTPFLKEVLSMTENVHNTYKRAPTPLKRYYLRFFFERFVVSKKRVVEATPTPIFETLLRANSVRLSIPWLRGQDSNLEP